MPPRLPRRPGPEEEGERERKSRSFLGGKPKKQKNEEKTKNEFGLSRRDSFFSSVPSTTEGGTTLCLSFSLSSRTTTTAIRENEMKQITSEIGGREALEDKQQKKRNSSFSFSLGLGCRLRLLFLRLFFFFRVEPVMDSLCVASEGEHTGGLIGRRQIFARLDGVTGVFFV